MANYYDWNPSEDKPKDAQPEVESNNQPAPITPPEDASPAVPLGSLAENVEMQTNPWASEEFRATPPTLLDDLDLENESTSEPIDAEDELHPMYRVVAAMMDEEPAETVTDKQVIAPLDEVVAAEEPVVVDGLTEGIPPTKLKNDDLIDSEFPPIPTRIDELTQAIERYPQSPVNYILRGEAHWDEGHATEAVRDFLAALNLAQGRDTTWEFLNRSFLDRARQGLRRCGYKNSADY